MVIDVTTPLRVRYGGLREQDENFRNLPDARLAAVLTIEQVERDEIIAVRHSVLRPNLPVESALYPEDEHPQIFHLAARDAAGAVIGCVTFFPEPRTADARPADDGSHDWRFRGMATIEEVRGKGIGGQLLEAGVTEAARRGGTTVWCNGRSTAKAFYLRHGFLTLGEEFTLPPGYHPHYVFVRELRRGG